MIFLTGWFGLVLIWHVCKSCETGEWACRDGKRCVREAQVCDMKIHCRDGSDEKYDVCALWQCAEGFWKCLDNKCIGERNVCNGYTSYGVFMTSGTSNCRDGSDELNEVCLTWNCSANIWKCANNKCIPRDQVCDGYSSSSNFIPNGCQDYSDEDPETCRQWNCSEGWWKCADGLKCIEEKYVCDGNSFSFSPRDCKDRSDELHCEDWVCPEGMWKCDNSQCIENEHVCAGSTTNKDCKDGSDEAYCKNMDCQPDMWKCNDGITCIHKIYVCDITHRAHCIDGSDELAALCLNWTCPPGYWKCRDNTTCILEKYI